MSQTLYYVLKWFSLKVYMNYEKIVTCYAEIIKLLRIGVPYDIFTTIVYTNTININNQISHVKIL